MQLSLALQIKEAPNICQVLSSILVGITYTGIVHCGDCFSESVIRFDKTEKLYSMSCLLISDRIVLRQTANYSLQLGLKCSLVQ
jgi:hypothetical protein